MKRLPCRRSGGPGRARPAAGPGPGPTTCVMNRTGMGSSPRSIMAFWRRSRLQWHSGQATTMASAPWARASSMIARPSRTTEAVRLTLKAPPQHSTFMFQSTASAPQALDHVGPCRGLLGVVEAARPRRAAPAGSRSTRRGCSRSRGLGAGASATIVRDGVGVAQQELDDALDLDAVGEGAAQHVRDALGHARLLGDRVARRGEAVVAGGAGRDDACRSPGLRRAPGYAPAAPRRAGGPRRDRWWRRSRSSRRARPAVHPGRRPRRAGSRRTRARCRAASSRGSSRAMSLAAWSGGSSVPRSSAAARAIHAHRTSRRCVSSRPRR